MKQIKDITVIPPDPKYDSNIRINQKQLNVAAYCRVSTRFEQQENSYEAQVKYYTEKIESNPKWNFVGIYADQGKTATDTKFRDSFNDMIADCYAGRIDMILTKSISRFARNTVDFLSTIRELKSKHIRIIFENENIDTMDSTGELLITILSSQAQEESRNLSENTRWGIVRRFEQGIVQVNHMKFMGYTKDLDGKLIVVPEEAEVVRKIFDLYLQGLGLSRIAKTLAEQGIKTATGNSKWHSSTIHKMLKCEKYIGDAMLQKTYTIDFLTKKRVKNDGIAKRYYIKNNHEPIVSREQYYLVQKELKKRNCKNQVKTNTRYSSKYPLSGLLICGECGNNYTRVTWHNKSGKLFVWRCRERIKSGVKQCKHSPTIKETLMMNSISNLLEKIKQENSDQASAVLLQTKAELYNCHSLLDNFSDEQLHRIIDQIVVNDLKNIEVIFKSGLKVVITL